MGGREVVDEFTEGEAEYERQGEDLQRGFYLYPGFDQGLDSLCIQGFDPGLGLLAPINPMMAGISLVPPPPGPPGPPIIKEIIHCQSCTLFPQNPNDHKFSEATAVLFTWIDRGEVNRRSANNFYSMIQSANSHVRRLMSEKAQHEEEMELAKETFKNALLAILTQFEQITAVFTAASRQKAWDHFSKAQRKNIDIWRKQCEELRNAHSEEIMGIRREEEMEMSDDDSDENPCKKIRMEENGVCGQSGASLREENDSLRWQLDAYRNEVELLRKEQGKACRPDDPEHFPDTHTHLLQQSMHNMQQVHTHTCYSRACTTCNRYIHTPATAEHAQHATEHALLLVTRVTSVNGQYLMLVSVLISFCLVLCLSCSLSVLFFVCLVLCLSCFQMLTNGGVVEGNNGETPEKVVNGCVTTLYRSRDRRSEAAMRGALTSEREALLLGIISTFLHVHPFGANIDYLWSYIQRLDTTVSAGELESLMGRLPSVFRQELSGVGATLEKRWNFCGFQSLSSV
nr:ecto-NOX disulfide-thiol exchanger 1-like [Oncorhynchus nerka]